MIQKNIYNTETDSQTLKTNYGKLRGKKLSDKESACQCKRFTFDPWIEKIPWSRKWQLTPVFLPGTIPWAEKPGRLQARRSQKVGHD